jgi:hypothetical protein
MDDAEMEAFAASHLRALPAQTVARLTERAYRRHVPAGDTLHRAGDDVRHVELVVRGLVRVHATAPDGRTLTLRYCHTGALMGILSLYGDPFVMPATTQALMDTDLLAMDPFTVRRMADHDVAVAMALLIELSERASAFAAEIGGAASMSGSVLPVNFLIWPLNASAVQGWWLRSPSRSLPMRWGQCERSSSVRCATCDGKSCCRPAGAALSSRTRNGCSRRRTEGGT